MGNAYLTTKTTKRGEKNQYVNFLIAFMEW